MKLYARWALPVYSVFKDKKSNGSDEKSVKRKIAFKKDQQDYTIAINSVWEQLIRHPCLLKNSLLNCYERREPSFPKLNWRQIEKLSVLVFEATAIVQ